MTTRKAGLGELETLVMLAVLRLSERADARHIRAEMDERAGRAISRGAMYATLARMERKGLLRVSSAGGDAGQRGAPQRFEVTESGLETLREAQANLDRMREGLGALLRSEGR